MSSSGATRSTRSSRSLFAARPAAPRCAVAVLGAARRWRAGHEGGAEAGHGNRRALFFLGALLPVGNERLRRSAEMGYAPAQVLMASVGGSFEVQFSLLDEQGDREGLARTASYLLEGVGCAKQRNRAKLMLEEAIELNHAEAPLTYGTEFFFSDDVLWYRWWGVALERGCPWATYMLIRTATTRFDSGCDSTSPRIMFELGAALRFAEMRPKSRRELKSSLPGTKCLLLYNRSIASARDAVNCWLVVGRRLGVAKDMRVLIAQIAWKYRAAWSVLEAERAKLP
jgi:hypothetical protein